MTFTTHGHHIPGTIVDGHTPSVARCGGIKLCQVCSLEAVMVLAATGTPSELIEEAITKTKETTKVENQTTAASITPKKFSRRPFVVEAVQVTEENFEAVAEWCGGSIVRVQEPVQTTIPDLGTSTERRFISVEVSRPLSRRQTEAYVGDWVLYASRGFKVYANRPFMKNFVEGSTFDDQSEELFVTAEAAQAADAVSELWPS